MNVYAWIGLLVGAIAGCSGPTAAPHDLQGLWSSDARTKGGLGSQWFFTDNGGVTNTFGALVDFTYKVEGSLIKTTFREEGQPPQETAEEFVLASNTLTLNPADDKKKQIMMRIGADGDGSNPLIGEWTYPHYTGGQAIVRYSSKGIMQLSVPFQTIKGTYSLAGDRLTIQLEGKPPTNVAFEVHGPKMVISDGKSSNAFTRFGF